MLFGTPETKCITDDIDMERTMWLVVISSGEVALFAHVRIRMLPDRL